jgi:hypothetical protein
MPGAVGPKVPEPPFADAGSGAGTIEVEMVEDVGKCPVEVAGGSAFVDVVDVAEAGLGA